MLLSLSLSLVGGLVGVLIALERGRRWPEAFLLGALLGPIGWIITAFGGRR